IGAQLIDLGDRTVLLGTTDPVIAAVEVETDDGAAANVPLVDPPGLARNVWMTAHTPDEVAVVRALAGDGSEVRRLVVGDETAYLILERGDRGPRVQQWQRHLNQVTGTALATDGIFGSNTVTATENFQRFFGLRADGTVGPATRDTMDFILALQGGPTDPPDEDDPEGALGEPTTGESSSGDFPGTGEPSFITDVRVGEHRGFDRVVIEFEGDVPSWAVEPVSRPIRESPSGRTISVAGDAFLAVRMAPASGVDLRGSEPEQIYTGPQRIDVSGSAITEVVRTSDFENVTSWVIGLRDDHEYGVAELADPSRLVIDVRG
ncbi:MAG TPA: peptidoglycan-binding domain-containing protein, partial [Acidimicrobiales bacterium]|nr:peptidoglycan-binding domain-containing protein [Acidimicrobiales bacterium]